MHKFDIYNKKHGWEAGDKALKEFALLLNKLFKDAVIFRARANDFIVLLKDDVLIKHEEEELEEFIKRAELEFSFNIYNLKKDEINSYNDIKKFL